ncbi:MAG: (d)CMP kinase [Firmicutes bacterium]|nr:(d)CMP kinase [Bacillota bacterium]
MTARQIAIDGPAGAGKSTVAKLVADRLGYLYIDTGAMYRAVALLALEQGVAVDDAAGLVGLIAGHEIDLQPASAGCRVLIDGRDVSQDIRLPQVGNAASPVSAVAEVRRLLVARQQQLAASRPVVMDGRDIGTVVLPEAGCKVFLTASSRVRAQRRAHELRLKGLPVDLEQVEREIIERDLRDSTRAASPLTQADDAVLVDSSDMTIEQVVTRIIELAEGAEA